MYKIYTNNLCWVKSRIPKFLLIMKLTALLIFVIIMQASASSFAQRVTLKQDNLTLKQLFKAIQTQTGYDVLYQPDKINTGVTIQADFKDTPLLEVLNKAFAGQPLTYTIDDKTIVVKEKNFLENLKDKIKAELAQVTVTGKVVDELGNPMPNVTVKQKDNPNNGAITDAKGGYNLTLPSDNSIVMFSHIGYETQEFSVRNLPSGSTVTLKVSETSLHEVIIDKGYYKERKELSTGDVSVVSAKTIEEQPVTDPIQALIGRVAGLNIQQTSGVPGAYATIHIRGLNSIKNGNDPYYIIDGVPYSSLSLSTSILSSGALGFGSLVQNTVGGGLSPFNSLNPDDIENIEILKDADATAIYGSKAANGVILITTKKGKAGDTKVNFDVSQGIGQVGHFMNMLNTQQYLTMRRQAYKNDGLAVPSITASPTNNAYDINGVWDTTRYTNWQKVMIGGTAQYTNAQGSISGGNANTQFLIGGSYTRQTTVYPVYAGSSENYGDTKGSLHFNLTHSSSNQKFHVQLSGSYVNENNNVPGGDLTSAIKFAPDAPALLNPNGSLNWQFYNGSPSFFNPLASTLLNYSSVVNNLITNLDLSYQLLPGLVLKSNFGYTHSEMAQNQTDPATSTYPPFNTNPLYRSVNFGNNLYQGWVIDPQLSYQRKIAKGQLNVLIGATLQQNIKQSTIYTAYGFASDALLDNPASASTLQLLGNQYTLYRYNSVYARVGYTWDEKYLLNLTANRDGSSRFGPGKQFGNFGAVGAGWIFSKEKSIQNGLPWLSFGKLRASYGTTGNDQFTDYQYLSTYNSSSITYQGLTQLTPANLTNPYYAWEVVKKLEGGLDLGFVRNRINLSISYYSNRTGNELVGYPLPSIAGFTSVQYNLPAVIQNSGLEIELNTINFKTKDFNWTSSVNFSLPENKLISFPGIASSSYATSYVVGKSLFIKEFYQYTGINPQTGLYSFATNNANGNPSSPQDIVATNPVTQKYYGGIGNNFSYKGFGLDIFMQFVKQLGYGYQNYLSAPGTINFNEPTAVLGAWQTPSAISSIQRYGTGSATNTPYGNIRSSTGILTDASFVRLKNVALYYRLPVQWQQWAHMENAKIYFQGQNLYTFTKYTGLDPENYGSALTLPALRILTLGFSASF